MIRYFPSKKGWRVLDIRNATCVRMNIHGAAIDGWRGQIRGKKYYPNEDAAVMVALHMLGQQPELALT